MHIAHCVKSVQIGSYFWYLRIQSKYRKMRTGNNSVFGHFSRSGNENKYLNISTNICLFPSTDIVTITSFHVIFISFENKAAVLRYSDISQMAFVSIKQILSFH